MIINSYDIVIIINSYDMVSLESVFLIYPNKSDILGVEVVFSIKLVVLTNWKVYRNWDKLWN